MIKFTGLWKQTDKEGRTYYSGKLGYGAMLLIFPNRFKKEDAHPDLNVYIAEIKKKEEGESREKNSPGSQGSTAPAGPESEAESKQEKSEFEDDIPF